MGFLGPKGTHSEAAAIYLNGLLNESCSLAPYPDIYSAMRAVELGRIESCLVPVENSLEGSINIALDTLAHCDELYVANELVWRISNCLMGVRSDVAIKKIISHEQPLSQCRDYIRKNYPDVELEPVASTAKAAELVSMSKAEDGLAAICSSRAGRMNGLVLLAENIQDNDNNCTRFYWLRRGGGEMPVKWFKSFNADNCRKTLLIFQMDGKSAGQLCEVLQDLATRKINLTRIESRPARTALGEYIFFLDIDVPDQEYRLDDAIEDISQKTIWLKNPGRYYVLHVLGNTDAQ